MANLINALKRSSNKNRKDLSEQSAITEAQRLIADKGAEDMEILKEMGMHHSVMKAIDLHGKRIELENLELKYGKVFSIEEIKEVACKYALKFKRSDDYRGAVDPVMLQKMKEFFHDSGIELNKAKMGYNFYILAPSKAFNLIDRPVPAPPDPILFYKLDEHNYRLIHKWGSDLTPFRRLIGWKYKRALNYFLIYLTILSIPGLICTQFNVFWNEKGQEGLILIPILLFAAAATISTIRIFSDWGTEFRNWKDIWMDNYKPKL